MMANDVRRTKEAPNCFLAIDDGPSARQKWSAAGQLRPSLSAESAAGPCAASAARRERCRVPKGAAMLLGAGENPGPSSLGEVGIKFRTKQLIQRRIPIPIPIPPQTGLSHHITSFSSAFACARRSRGEARRSRRRSRRTCGAIRPPTDVLLTEVWPHQRIVRILPQSLSCRSSTIRRHNLSRMSQEEGRAQSQPCSPCRGRAEPSSRLTCRMRRLADGTQLRGPPTDT